MRLMSDARRLEERRRSAALHSARRGEKKRQEKKGVATRFGLDRDWDWDGVGWGRRDSGDRRR